ncbi:ABC transporter ATP-binding protein [Lacrimispora sp. NSJ-141]|uniref:ABC transporter ATP-binding protein n=1 Tax=Lientehia hominis TaxID=2897778 RepID=A0AAP2RIJ2_9FIRM|nr:ABC transporter ATP-binding protein [Lientehia hominis]MCD2492003.1 ABC transporter ATP-binding protein [Lientehia hominis]
MGEVLRTEGVCRYFGGLKAVENVSMTVNSGQIFGIIGPNGAGKTTFFNVCSGIYKPTKGRVYLCGRDISNMRPETISRLGITRTFQSMQLFKFMTVLENVKIGCHKGTKSGIFDAIFHTGRYKRDEEYVTRKSLETIEKAGLTKYAYTMAGSLPYGIQRRVEIARALATDPEILLLDEPAAGMNPMETVDLRKFVQELNRNGQTILLIEHDMKFVMNCCHNILVLNFGKKICEGTPEVVKKDPEVQAAYFGSGMIGGEVLNHA